MVKIKKTSGGLYDEIEKILTFDLIKPTNVWGKNSDFIADYEIEMENGDYIEYYYEENAGSGKIINWIKINNKKIDLTGEEPLHDLRREYKKHLISKINA